MTLLYDALALLALLVTAYLLFLLFFEPGIRYEIRGTPHQADDGERLRLLCALLGAQARAVEHVEVLNYGTDLYEPQLAAIRAARCTIHLEAYIFEPGRIADAFLLALTERARAGVNVRLTLDAFGSFAARPSLFATLVHAGAHVARYHALSWRTFRRLNSRTHRNLLIIDGVQAFVGGAGIADHWSAAHPRAWRDCVLHVRGAAAGALQGVFAENWLEAHGELLIDEGSFPRAATVQPATSANCLVVGSTPTAGLSTRARVLMQFMLASARGSIDLCSPYFIPDMGIRHELRAACGRGVRVRVLTGGRHADHLLAWRAGRRRYGSLLRAGVQLFEYAPRMMHVKAMVIDGRWSVLGSTNIDHRSFGLNDEVNVALVDAGIAAELTRSFESDLAQSARLDLAAWQRRSWTERLLATAGRLLERHQ